MVLSVCLDLGFGEQHLILVLSEHHFFYKRLREKNSEVFTRVKSVTRKVRVC